MSALRIDSLKKRSEYPFCANRCVGMNGIRAAKFRVTLAGYPVGVLCPSCAKSWRATWDEALGGTGAKPNGEALGCGPSSTGFDSPRSLREEAA